MLSRRSQIATGLLASMVLVASACSGGDEADPAPTASSTTSVAPTTSVATTTTTSTTTTTRPDTTTTLADPQPLVVLLDESLAPVVEAAADRFEADTAIPVELRVAAVESIRREVLGSDTGVDVFFADHRWTAELVEAGVAQPIDMGIRSDEWLEVALAGFRSGGTTYGIPLAVDGIALYRNTDLVPEPVASFEELREICDGLGERIEWCLGHPDPDDGLRHHAFVASGDAYLFAETDDGYDTGEIGLERLDAVASLTVLDQLVEGGYVPVDAGYDEMVTGFAEGRSAFLIGGIDALDAGRASEIPLSVGPLPDLAGERAAPLATATGFAINASSVQPAAALLFLFDYVSAPEVAADVEATPFGLPALVAAADLLEDAETVTGLLTSIASSRAVPNIPETTAGLEAIAEAVQRVYAQSAEPEAALGAATARLEAAIIDG